MNSRWMRTIFILSLAGNCMVAGALTYEYVFAPPEQSAVQDHWRPYPRGDHFKFGMRRSMQDKIAPERQKIQQAREKIVELLRQDNPDREQIYREISTIAASQAAIQRMVMDQLMQKLQTLSPEQKAACLDRMKDPRFWRGAFGKGRGRGRGRDFSDAPFSPQPDMPPP